MKADQTTAKDDAYAELTAAGVPERLQHKRVVTTLINDILRPGDHIHAAIIGRTANRWSAMLVATDSHILYIEADLLFHSYDEINYSTIDGVSYQPTLLFDSVTLNARERQYTINMVATDQAKQFVHVVEDMTDGSEVAAAPATASQAAVKKPDEDDETSPMTSVAALSLSAKQQAFLAHHSMAVLSSSSRTGDIYSGPVYFVFKDEKFYILTRRLTHNSRNIFAMPSVALTIYDHQTTEYLTIQGYAEVVKQDTIRQFVYNAVAELSRTSQVEKVLWDTSNGEYVVFAISPTSVVDELS